MFNQVGLPEVIIVLAIVLLIFGPKRLPQAGRALGKGMREFKDSITGNHKDDQELDEATSEATPEATQQAATADEKSGSPDA